jgi:DNA-binding MarR family transcriptional regulator
MPATVDRRNRKRQRAVKAQAVRRKGAQPAAAQAMRRELELRTLQGFRLIFASARAHDAEVRRIAGIPGSQLWALAEIARGAGMSVNALSERMALHQTTASNLVNALVERNLIRRMRDEADQRVVRLHVTTDGKRMLLRAPGPYAGLLVDALRNLEASQLTRLHKSLGVLMGGMREPKTTAAGETLLGE